MTSLEIARWTDSVGWTDFAHMLAVTTLGFKSRDGGGTGCLLRTEVPRAMQAFTSGLQNICLP